MAAYSVGDKIVFAQTTTTRGRINPVYPLVILLVDLDHSWYVVTPPGTDFNIKMPIRYVDRNYRYAQPDEVARFFTGTWASN
jgi:hypothetical protein